MSSHRKKKWKTPSLPQECGFMRAGSCAWCIAGTHYLLNQGAHHDQASPPRSAKPFRGEQFANQVPWSQLHRRDKWEKLERSGAAEGWVKSGCQNDLWLYEVWQRLTPHTQAHPGTHTQVHRRVLKHNLCTLGVSVKRVWWRLVPEVQPSFPWFSPLKTWALKGKTISFLDGEKEAQGY